MPKYSAGSFLDVLASFWGLTRRAATPAIGEVEFTLSAVREEDIFIPATYVNGALHKDVVKVKVTKKTGGEGKRREGMILKILERGCKTLVGTFQKNTSFGFVLPDDRHYDKDIFIFIEGKEDIFDIYIFFI